ncbi:MAG TPA: hypothetical protein VJL07_02775 [Dehalococcoidia bacterium]|nr:hypothetical protein [Dehalococcoidia bacterium]
MCECLDRGDGTAHVDECCLEDWLAFREGQKSGVYMLAGKKFAKQMQLLRAVAEAAERVWNTVPAEYGGAKAMVHARALNDMRDALIAAREGGALP